MSFSEYHLTKAQSQEYRKKTKWLCYHCCSPLRAIKNDREKRGCHLKCEKENEKTCAKNCVG